MHTSSHPLPANHAVGSRPPSGSGVADRPHELLDVNAAKFGLSLFDIFINAWDVTPGDGGISFTDALDVD